MSESGIVADAADSKKLGKPATILVPPRGSMESMFMNGSGPGFSPGPMTLLASFFPEQGSFSFSQLLAGAMVSPVVELGGGGLWGGEEEGESSCREDGGGGGEPGESGVGYKRNRPVSLVVNQPQMESESFSPVFMVPPGLSPSGFLNSPGFLSPLQSPFGMSHQQALAHVTAQAALSKSYKQMQAELQHSSSTATAEAVSETLTNNLPTEPEYLKIESPDVSQSDREAAYIAGDKPANDGYNWRKYGQKQVKASECVRSYYRCTHLDCLVKKKVEQSFDGRISEITYKGEHNHDPPQPSKRGKDSYASDRTTFASGQAETNRLNEALHVNSEPAISDAADQFSFENPPVIGHNHDIEDNAIVLDDEDDDEPAAKRRRMDTGALMPTSSCQTITESKIVVQTRSEVDFLDDGYKWRKYGQKVVKGNPNPRSYYRCTYAGCNVRKHVERAAEDPKSVVTTYEGKHNHDIPTGRFRGQPSAQQSKTQKVAPKSRSLKEMDLLNKDQIPMTLQLKEEQMAA